MTASQRDAVPATMNALRAGQRGGPEQFHYGTTPTPAPADGEVLIAVHAAAITFAELTWDEIWQRRPVVPSHEVSGVVVDAGDGTGWSPGDEVFGLLGFDRQGGAAEYVTAPAGDVARKPVTASHPVAAAVPLSGLTAWQALDDRAHVRPGERVLVHGGAGGVGTFTVQLAARLGAEVTATARGADLDRVRQLGAEHVLDFTRQRLEELSTPFDVVIDTVSGATLEQSYGLLRPGGRLITLAGPPDAARAAEHGVDAQFFIVRPDRAQLEQLAALVDSGELEVPLARTYPLGEGAAAYASGSNPGRAPGKTVLVVRN